MPLQLYIQLVWYGAPMNVHTTSTFARLTIITGCNQNFSDLQNKLGPLKFWGLAQRRIDITVINQEQPSDPEHLCFKTTHYCLDGFLLIPDGIRNSTLQVIPQRDHRCLPQNFVSAMTASVPLTAVQVTDADLLKKSKKTNSWSGWCY